MTTFPMKRSWHRRRALDRFGNACITFTCNEGSDTSDDDAPAVLIRLPDYIDAEVKALQDDPNGSSFVDKLWHKIQSVHDQLATESLRLSNVNLYPRSWKSICTTNSAADCDSCNNNRSSFTVATFNTLARGLSSGPNSIFPPPFLSMNSNSWDSVSDGNYGGFTHLSQPHIVLDYETRKWRLVHVLFGGGLVERCEFDAKIGDGRAVDVNRGNNMSDKAEAGLPFDILALQEVDDFHSFWCPLLVRDDASNQSIHGAAAAAINTYHGVFQPKPNSPCVRFGWHSDGVALLWNANKFCTIKRPCSCIVEAEKSTGDFADATFDYFMDKGSFEGDAPLLDAIPVHDTARKAAQNQVYIIVPLQRIGTDQIVIVAATHLKAKKGYTNERIRHLQALELKSRVNGMADKLQSNGWTNIRIIIMGDFNSEPNDASVQCILDPNGSDSLLTMQSAYNLQDPNLYSTWKARKDGSVCRTIDFIFYSNVLHQDNRNDDNNKSDKTNTTQLQCKEILAVPEKENVDELLPGFRYPSDHLLMAAKFDWS